jgi:hypothetical protein
MVLRARNARLPAARLQALTGVSARSQRRIAHQEDFGKMTAGAIARRNARIAVAMHVGPGLWIGMMASNPVAAAVAARLATYVIWRLNALRLPVDEREPIISRAYLWRFVRELVVLCSSARAGGLFRSFVWAWCLTALLHSK